MKVLEIVTNAFHIGSGIYTVVSSLYIELQKKNVNVDILIVDIPDHELGADVYQYKKNFFEKDFNKYDLIVFHGIFNLHFLKISQYLEKQKIPYLVKPHSSLMKAAVSYHFLKKSLFLIYSFRFLRKARAILFINDDERKNSLTIFNNNNIIEMNIIERISGKNSFIKHDKGIGLFFISRIDINHKGLDLLLKAIKNLVPFFEQNHCSFTFYGNGNEQNISYLKKEINKLNTTTVNYYGPVYGKEKYDMMEEKDILVLTSRYEGFPTVIPESLAFGIPVICSPGTNAAFIQEMGAGWCCKNLTVKNIQNCIYNAILDYQKNYLYYRKNSIEVFNKLCDKEKTICKTLEIYSKYRR